MNIGRFIIVFFCCWQFAAAQEGNRLVRVPPGSTVRLTAASGGAVGYQWYRDGEEIEGAVEAVYEAAEQGSYTALSFNAEGCQSDLSEAVMIRFSGSLLPPSGQKDQFFCGMLLPVIADMEVTGTGVIWYDSAAGGRRLLADDLLEDGNTYYAAQASANGEHESRERLGVTVHLDYCPDLEVRKTVDNPSPMPGSEVAFTVAVANKTAIAVRDIVIADRLPSGFDYRLHRTDRGSYSTGSGIWEIPRLDSLQEAELKVYARVLPQGDHTNIARLENSDPGDTDASDNEAAVTVVPSCLKVYNLFSPNGDGINDTFRVECIERYPDNRLEVYNRYGNMVYRMKGYDNSWSGTSNVKNTISRNGQLPVGTYYYVLDPGDGSDPLTGWLFITR
ncbi:T9SS type B sorting domain-containing protein [Sinomicrobium soli]|uniref:T9SS type B sorting domain-containing protein n=1 Tax=Sinomicrobium sp. N-1-3-6 TaxID=2219864 RepID=UPI0013750256|nr:gliding motility-associated C-terminal domain-containing protein [Sinomicrobium sp. N-1-3-6]